MSQAKIYSRLGLPTAIKSVRQRKHINTTELARLLGVTQGQVSRYESGKAVPGYLPLSRLLELAEGIERNIILDHIAAFLGPPAGEEKLTQEELRAMADWFAGLSQSNVAKAQRGTSDENWGEICSATPNLAQLVEIVGRLFLRRREVDSSLVQIVLDWDDQVDDADPVVRQCFRDAAEYLEYLLEKRTHGKCWHFGRAEQKDDTAVDGEGQGRRSA